MLRLPHRGKGQALTLAEREAAPGRLLLCDADLAGDLTPLVERDGDLVVAAFARRQGGGFGLAKGTARRLIALATGRTPREPLSGQRVLSTGAREPRASRSRRGFGVETRMTVDALRAGLELERGRARARAPRHRPRSRRLRPPRPPAPRPPARLRPAGDEPPRPAAAARRLGRRARRAARRAGRAARARGRPLERRGARLPRPPPRGPDDRRAQARSGSRSTRSCGRARSPARCSSRSPRTLRQPARHAARPGAEGVRARLARAPPNAARSRRSRRPPRSLRSSRDGDAGGLRIERARRRARFRFRGAVFTEAALERDRGARGPHPPRRTPFARDADRADARRFASSTRWAGSPLSDAASSRPSTSSSRAASSRRSARASSPPRSAGS